MGDAVVGSHPVRPALRPVDRAAAAITGLGAGCGWLPLRRSEDIWNQDDINTGERISVAQRSGAGWSGWLGFGFQRKGTGFDPLQCQSQSKL